MFVTEKEAATKWCPEVRTGLTAGIAVNNHVADSPNNADGVWHETRCIGSNCMMWIWADSVETHPAPKGYCGKAYK